MACTPGIRISGKSRSVHSLRALSLHVSVKSSVGHVEVAHVCFDAEAPGAPKCHMNPLGANPGLDDQPYSANNRAGLCPNFIYSASPAVFGRVSFYH